MFDFNQKYFSKSSSVDILLSTFNGERYIDELLLSLNNQSFSDWSLIVRDDHSSDNTFSILKNSFAKFSKPLKLLDSGIYQLGASQSFSRLLESSGAPYSMFCDQDDIWFEDKILMSLKAMNNLEQTYGKNIPLLVHTDLTVTDSHLNPISESFWDYQNLDPKSAQRLNRVLVQNVVTGCTILINQALRELASPIPDECIMHDWWIALVAAAFGEITYIEAPTVLYRQHQSNSIGSKKWGLKYIFSRAINPKDIKIYFKKTICQARAFLDIYHSSLDIESLKLVETYSKLNEFGFFQKRAALLKNGYYELGSLRNLGLFLAI